MKDIEVKPALSQTQQRLLAIEKELDQLMRIPQQRSLSIDPIEPIPQRRIALLQESERLKVIIRQEQSRQSTQADIKPKE